MNLLLAGMLRRARQRGQSTGKVTQLADNLHALLSDVSDIIGTELYFEKNPKSADAKAAHAMLAAIHEMEVALQMFAETTEKEKTL